MTIKFPFYIFNKKKIKRNQNLFSLYKKTRMFTSIYNILKNVKNDIKISLGQ